MLPPEGHGRSPEDIPRGGSINGGVALHPELGAELGPTVRSWTAGRAASREEGPPVRAAAVRGEDCPLQTEVWVGRTRSEHGLHSFPGLWPPGQASRWLSSSRTHT